MATKANRTRAAERIEKAKKVYGLAEDKTDSVLLRLAADLAASPYTVIVVLVTFVACVVVFIL